MHLPVEAASREKLIHAGQALCHERNTYKAIGTFDWKCRKFETWASGQDHGLCIV
jgi:hypothetical protein